jgi:hypothetical protein
MLHRYLLLAASFTNDANAIAFHCRGVLRARRDGSRTLAFSRGPASSIQCTAIIGRPIALVQLMHRLAST